MNTHSGSRPPCAAIVHPWSTGSYVAAALATAGWRAVAVIPARPLAIFDHLRGYDPGDYVAIVSHDGDITATAARLAELAVTAVIPGTESGVVAADALAAALGLPGNDPRTSSRRRSKGEMASALAQAGLAHPCTIPAWSLGEALDAARVIGAKVVVKPDTGAGGDGVTFCRDAADVEAAWRAAIGRENVMGIANDRLLVQRHIDGPLFTVNTVTCADPAGRAVCYVGEVWRDTRSEVDSGKVIYDREDLLCADTDVARQISGYIGPALAALGVITGAVHSEVIVTPDGGPVLVEANCRLAGLIDPPAEDQALGRGRSHVGLAVDALTDPKSFLERHQDPYQMLAPAAVHLDLIADRAGVVDGATLTEITRLPTVRGLTSQVQPGAHVTATVDLATSPGRIVLAGAAADVEADVACIRHLEDRLYR
jgi:hypothetical protein